MYNTRDVNSVRELNRKAKSTPSFSSTLLDDIYRSIDDGSARSPRDNQRDRAEKWIEKIKKKKSLPLAADTKKLHHVVDNNDALFFSSGSNSSDSNSSLFSDQHDSIQLSSAKTRSSCFLPPKPKPIRTRATLAKTEAEHEDEDGVVPKSSTAKSRALKMYAHLKKMKQPISPGMKLTTFINSILQNSKSKHRGTEAADDRSKKPTTKCSSATSFGRYRASYLNQQTTPFPDTLNMESDRPRILKLKRDDEKIPNSAKIELPKPVDDDDGRSSSSSSDCSDDLFEIDHLKLRFELPVYETTTSKSNTSRLSSTTNQTRMSNFGGRR